MNSFNHYSLGSIGEWMFRYMAGIDTDAAKPGFQHILIRPQPGGSLSHVHAEYASLYGTIAVEWQLSDSGTFRLKVTVPVNTTATVEVPGNGVTIDGVSVHGEETVVGCYPLGEENGVSQFQIGSGVFVFERE